MSEFPKLKKAKIPIFLLSEHIQESWEQIKHSRLNFQDYSWWYKLIQILLLFFIHDWNAFANKNGKGFWKFIYYAWVLLSHSYTNTDGRQERKTCISNVFMLLLLFTCVLHYLQFRKFSVTQFQCVVKNLWSIFWIHNNSVANFPVLKWKKYVENLLWQAAKSVENVPSLLVACVQNLMSKTVCFPKKNPLGCAKITKDLFAWK